MVVILVVFITERTTTSIAEEGEKLVPTTAAQGTVFSNMRELCHVYGVQ